MIALNVEKILCIVYPFFKGKPPSERVMHSWLQLIFENARNPNAVLFLLNDFSHPTVGREAKNAQLMPQELQGFFNFACEKFGENRVVEYYFPSPEDLLKKIREHGIVFGKNAEIERIGQHAGGTSLPTCVEAVSKNLSMALSRNFPESNFNLKAVNPRDCVEFPVDRIARIRERFGNNPSPRRRLRLTKLLTPKPK